MVTKICGEKMNRLRESNDTHNTPIFVLQSLFMYPYEEVDNLCVKDGTMQFNGRETNLPDGKYHGITDISSGKTWIESSLDDYQKVYTLIHEHIHRYVSYFEPLNDNEDYVKAKTDEVMEMLDELLNNNSMSYHDFLRAVESNCRVIGNDGCFFSYRGNKANPNLVTYCWKIPFEIVKCAAELLLEFVGNLLGLGGEPYNLAGGFRNTLDNLSNDLTEAYRKQTEGEEKEKPKESGEGQQKT